MLLKYPDAMCLKYLLVCTVQKRLTLTAELVLQKRFSKQCVMCKVFHLDTLKKITWTTYARMLS